MGWLDINAKKFEFTDRVNLIIQTQNSNNGYWQNQICYICHQTIEVMIRGRIFLLMVTGTVCLLTLFASSTTFGTVSTQEDLECNPEMKQTCNDESNGNSSATNEVSVTAQAETSASDVIKPESTTTPTKIYNIFVGIGYPSWYTNYDLNDPKPELYSMENEIVMVAYVQGKKVQMVDKAFPFRPNNIGNVDGAGHVAVDVPQTTPLSIMVFAYEADGCPHYQFPDDIHDKVVKDFKPLTVFGKFDPLHPLRYTNLQKIASDLNSKINSLCGEGQDEHEVLNPINIVYQPIHTSEKHGKQPWGGGHFSIHNVNEKGRADFAAHLCIYPTPGQQIFEETCLVYNGELYRGDQKQPR